MSAFSLEIEATTHWPPAASAALERARRFWLGVIQGSLDPVEVEGRRIDGLLIFAGVIPGPPGGTFATGKPEALRPKTSTRAPFLPATARLWLEEGDITDHRLERVLIHEIGHCLGFGTEVWTWTGLIKGAGGTDPTFIGSCAMAEYGRLTGAAPTPVPVENKGGPAAANRHWRETIFGEEIMSSYLSTAHNPLSRLTIASLADLGYLVSDAPAEDYDLPRTRLLHRDGKAQLDQFGKGRDAYLLSPSALISE